MSVHYYFHSSRYTQCQALILSSLQLFNFEFLIHFFFLTFFSVPARLPFSYDPFFSDQRDHPIRNFPTLLACWSFFTPSPGSQFDTVDD